MCTVSTPSWPPRFPSSQVRLPPRCSARQSTGTRRGPQLVWLYLVGAGGWGRPISRCLFFSERSRLVCSHRPRPRPGASEPDRSDGPQWAPHLIDCRQSNSQARACIVHHVHLSLRHRRRRAFLPRRFVFARSAPVHAWPGSVDRAWDVPRPRVLSHRSRKITRRACIAAALGLVPALTLPSQIAKACVRLGSKQPSNPARTDDSTDPLPISMALPRLSTRHFGLRRPAQVWTDAAPLPLFGPLAREGDGTGQRFVAPACARCRSAPSPRCC